MIKNSCSQFCDKLHNCLTIFLNRPLILARLFYRQRRFLSARCVDPRRCQSASWTNTDRSLARHVGHLSLVTVNAKETLSRRLCREKTYLSTRHIALGSLEGFVLERARSFDLSTILLCLEMNKIAL